MEVRIIMACATYHARHGIQPHAAMRSEMKEPRSAPGDPDVVPEAQAAAAALG
jgi:hypothetical protein